MEVTVKLRTPHPKQAEFVDATQKRIIVRAGRRGGKTVGMAQKAVKRFLEGRRQLYAAPTTAQVDAFWFEVKRALAELIDSKMVRMNKTEHLIEFEGTKQAIKAKTAWNADTLRGDYADDLILDEFQLMHETTWTEVGAPMLLDNGGNACFIYTPPSRKTNAATKADDPRYVSKLFKAAATDTTGRWAAFHFTSHDNPHLDTESLDEITEDMTDLAYRQEILAEDIDEVPGALWSRQLIDRTRVDRLPTDDDENELPLKRIVVAVDPAGSSGKDSDDTGICVAGLGYDDHVYIMQDATVSAATPDIWANAALNAYDDHDADRIIAEKNQGGEMVEHTLKVYQPGIPYRGIHAKRGKLLRADPVSALFEKGMVHLVGVMPDLEDQMVSWTPGADSPDRLDAMVYAVTELKVKPRVAQRVKLKGF